MDLDARCKATLIGAAFLIDFMFYEKKAATNGPSGPGNKPCWIVITMVLIFAGIITAVVMWAESRNDK